MERINPYAVMRNTATYEAFLAYHRKAVAAGQPYFALGFAGTIIGPLLLSFGGRWLLHKSPLDGRWALMSIVLVFALSGVCAAIGLMRTVRFRRGNPIPDEWRQVPRVSPPPVPGRKPRLAGPG